MQESVELGRVVVGGVQPIDRGRVDHRDELLSASEQAMRVDPCGNRAPLPVEPEHAPAEAVRLLRNEPRDLSGRQIPMERVTQRITVRSRVDPMHDRQREDREDDQQNQSRSHVRPAPQETCRFGENAITRVETSESLASDLLSFTGCWSRTCFREALARDRKLKEGAP